MTEAMGSREIRVPASAEFGEYDFLEAPHLMALAEDLMRHWPELAHLELFRGRVMWRRKGAMSGGRAVFAKCQLTSGLLQLFSDADWIVTVAADFARQGEKDGAWFEALMYHEMAGLELVREEDEEGEMVPVEPPQLRARAHEFEGYVMELRRYGAWDPALGAAKAAFEEPMLPGFAGKAKAAAQRLADMGATISVNGGETLKTPDEVVTAVSRVVEAVTP